MSAIEDILAEMEYKPANIRFSDLCRVCDHYFGEPRQEGTSHGVYKTPWRGDPRVNIQSKKGKAHLPGKASAQGHREVEIGAWH